MMGAMWGMSKSKRPLGVHPCQGKGGMPYRDWSSGVGASGGRVGRWAKQGHRCSHRPSFLGPERKSGYCTPSLHTSLHANQHG